MSAPLLVLTPGDPEGVGPEITWKALRARHRRGARGAILCVGARAPFDALGAPVIPANAASLRAGVRPPKARGPFVWLLEAPTRAPGRLVPGYQSGWSIEAATRLVQTGIASALVTGPISKERLQKGGYRYLGHTDFLADLCGVSDDVTMMLANDDLRVTLVTTHLALKDVPRAITPAALSRCVRQTAEGLRAWWGIGRPRLAVAALNPHAGEAGLLGREEIRVIEPTLARLRRESRGRYTLDGPTPSDTLFAKHVLAARAERHDAVVCMYHDQGLIPVKQLDFPRTVNVTLGLPIVRTSVDHGVGFDIAGRGVADPSSLEAAIRLAFRLRFRVPDEKD
jgi:4-hydroxythreonine-4-phosphate dehydrogenase